MPFIANDPVRADDVDGRPGVHIPNRRQAATMAGAVETGPVHLLFDCGPFRFVPLVAAVNAVELKPSPLVLFRPRGLMGNEPHARATPASPENKERDLAAIGLHFQGLAIEVLP